MKRNYPEGTEILLDNGERAYDDPERVTDAIKQNGKIWVHIGYTADIMGHNSIDELMLDEDEARALFEDLRKIFEGGCGCIYRTCQAHRDSDPPIA